MRSNKRYTNVTFSKRVDHEAGRHRPPRGMAEPAICRECGAVYAERRWQKSNAAQKNRKHEEWRPAHEVVCPACKQQQNGAPGGFVYLGGAFLAAHLEEIEKLLLNEAERASEDNPLARIMSWEKNETGRLTLATTTELLAQRLGRALEKAFGGSVRYDFSHENKLARVTWHRD